MKKTLPIVVITGPTATGKTKHAVQLAQKFNGEIISVDSRQVYRRLDIGSGKDLQEYSSGGITVAHHLINIVEPETEYNLKEFCVDAWNAVDLIVKKNKLTFFCGGSTMYLDAILNQYALPGGMPNVQLRNDSTDKSLDELLLILKNIVPDEYDKYKDINNRNRLLRAIEIKQSAINCSTIYRLDKADIRYLIIGVYLPRAQVHCRIEQRLDDRLNAGMLDEVSELHRQGLSWQRLEFLGLEYRYVAQHLQGKLSYHEMRMNLLYKIRQFAKRQDIWFRKMEREGKIIHWINNDSQFISRSAELINQHLAGEQLPPPDIMLKDINYGNFVKT
jgi:tRNA dimethylallyltransferase